MTIKLNSFNGKNTMKMNRNKLIHFIHLASYMHFWGFHSFSVTPQTSVTSRVMLNARCWSTDTASGFERQAKCSFTFDGMVQFAQLRHEMLRKERKDTILRTNNGCWKWNQPKAVKVWEQDATVGIKLWQMAREMRVGTEKNRAKCKWSGGLHWPQSCLPQITV